MSTKANVNLQSTVSSRAQDLPESRPDQTSFERKNTDIAGEYHKLAATYEGTSLIEHTLFGTEDYVEKALREIRGQAKFNRLCLRFSGGKDSVVVKRLFDLAGVPYVARFSKTTVDPPELLQFIREEYPDVIVEPPKISMFNLIIKKGFPPTRICRYCCQEFKERNVCGKGDDILTVTGVRTAESPKRRSRAKVEMCLAYQGVTFYHPIIKWSDEQVWDFIHAERIPYCRLYDEPGITRIGCVGCPLTSPDKIMSEFRRWPQFEKAYLWAFEKMLEGRHFDKWKTKWDVMDWYIWGAKNDCKEAADRCQFSFFEQDYFGQLNDEDLLPGVDMARRALGY